jgi:hypothetical protein
LFGDLFVFDARKYLHAGGPGKNSQLTEWLTHRLTIISLGIGDNNYRLHFYAPVYTALKKRTPRSKLEYGYDLKRLNGAGLQDFTQDTFSIKAYGFSGPTAGLAGLFEPGPSIEQT